jgi:hypothetical protein
MELPLVVAVLGIAAVFAGLYFSLPGPSAYVRVCEKCGQQPSRLRRFPLHARVPLRRRFRRGKHRLSRWKAGGGRRLCARRPPPSPW